MSSSAVERLGRVPRLPFGYVFPYVTRLTSADEVRNFVRSSARDGYDVIQMFVGSAAVNASCFAFGDTFVDLRDGGMAIGVAHTCSSKTHVLADRFPVCAGFRVHPIALVRPDFRRVFLFVLLLVGRGALGIFNDPFSRVKVVAGFAIWKTTVLATFVVGKFVKWFRCSASGACLHAISITEKYNTATLLGWRILRFTTDMIRDGRAIRVIEEAMAA